MSTPHRPDRQPNRLAQQQSPYLLQHAYNPVDWYPWSEEAFEVARQQGKPIFLSIGYSTCHWCHVMERESFESEAIAALMNERFVNIKIDREERPDIDRVYMTFVQATTGHGGWPMSVWLTPSLRPFFGGTYFPPEARYGQPGFREILEQISIAWTERREEIEQMSAHVVQQLGQAAAARAADTQAVAGTTVAAGFEAFRRLFDREHGGFGRAPKFPQPAALAFLMSYHARTGNGEAARMALATLVAMARGGIQDHVGGGFHRYAVDRIWHVPHFEKMLYDQAQLARAYLEGYQLIGDGGLAEVAHGIFDYVLRDLTDPQTGAFFCAEDADSLPSPDDRLKREGAFYVWTEREIATCLGESAPVFSSHYDVQPQGNASDPHGELTGRNVLHVVRTVAEIAQSAGLAEADVEQQLREARARLLLERAARPRPHLDDKVLCGWNGMMISALARGSAVLGDARYLQAAQRAATFAEQTLYDAANGRLYRRYRAGQTAHEAYAEDYAQLVDGLLELYQADFDLRWLQFAEQLTEHMNALFWDDLTGGYFASSGRDASVLVRLKDDHDGAEPAASSLAACNLLRLAAMLDRPDWEQLAARTIQHFAARLRRTPEILPQMLIALQMRDDPPAQVVLVGERDDAGVQALLRAAHQQLVPNKVVLLANAAFEQVYGARLPHIAAMTKRDGRATAYVCRNKTCANPTTDPQQLIVQLCPGA